MRPRDSGTRESRPHAAEAAGPGSPAGFWSPWGVNTVSEAGVRTGAGAEGRTGQLRSYAARRPSQCFRARKTLGRVERHRHADGIGKWGGNAARLALLAHVEPWFRVDSRQAEEQQGAKCVDIAAHTRLPKPILLGRRIGRVPNLTVSASAPSRHQGDPQVDNHQR